MITSLGIVNMVINFLGTKQYPTFTETGLAYLAVLVAGTWVLNKVVTFIFQVVIYKINDIKLTKKF